MADDLRNKGKDKRKGKRVGIRASCKYGRDMAGKGKSHNTDTQVMQSLPLMRVTSWISPWGEVVQTASELVTHKRALAPKEIWIAGNKAWRATLK